MAIYFDYYGGRKAFVDEDGVYFADTFKAFNPTMMCVVLNNFGNYNAGLQTLPKKAEIAIIEHIARHTRYELRSCPNDDAMDIWDEWGLHPFFQQILAWSF